MIKHARQIMKQHVSVGNILLIALILSPWLQVPAHVQAQTNLLTNPGFEQAHGDGVTLSAPPGWSIWSNTSSGLVGRQLAVGQEVVASGGIYQGNGSFDAYKGWSAYSVSIYQTVGGITPGSTLRLTAFGRMWSCDSDVNLSSDPCITGDGQVVAQSFTNASFRVGIDPTGSNDPNAGSIVWSNATAPYDGFQQMIVDAAATAGSVTVVLNASMQLPARHQHVFWDAASLTLVDGSVSGDGGQTSAAAAAPPAIAAEVVPQGERNDGSIIHTVRSGDTMAAIAVAYEVTIPELLELNSMTWEDARYIYPGQELVVKRGTGEAAESSEETTPEEGDSGEAEAGSPGNTEPAYDSGRAPIESYENAPVVNAAVPARQMVEIVATGQICTRVFDDVNPNRLQESGELLLAGGQVDVTMGGAVISSYTTDGQSEPYCFENLAAGEYMVLMTPPQGYGATTPATYMVEVGAGQIVDATFGAAANFVPPQPPPAQGGAGLFSDETGAETDTRSTLDILYDNSGILVLGLAGLVLIGGAGLLLLLRR